MAVTRIAACAACALFCHSTVCAPLHCAGSVLWGLLTRESQCDTHSATFRSRCLLVAHIYIPSNKKLQHAQCKHIEEIELYFTKNCGSPCTTYPGRVPFTPPKA